MSIPSKSKQAPPAEPAGVPGAVIQSAEQGVRHIVTLLRCGRYIMVGPVATPWRSISGSGAKRSGFASCGISY